MNKRISRRKLLKALAAAAGSVGLGKVLGSSLLRGTAQELDKYVYLPFISKADPPFPGPTTEPTSTSTPTSTPTATPTATPTSTPTSPPTDSRVVHVHSDGATSWNGETDYWNYVNQDVVNDMVDQGVMVLTGASAVADAWRALLPNYQNGQGIAIKVNFNNSSACDDTSGKIDALIQPINAVVRGLKQIGVAEADIWVYDAIRAIPDRFVNGSQYGSVRFFGDCRDSAGWGSNDPDAYIAFSPPADIPVPPATRITDVLINATYLINMPIMKIHTVNSTGVTLGFKNHFGTIQNPSALHDYVAFFGSYYRADYNPFVDIYQNPHIAGKTVLTIGDGLFASRRGYALPPGFWATFQNQVPNSLFFATDPVAIDCVMCDFLAAETTVPAEADDYLRLANDAGLGVFERGAPWGSGYSQIDYLKIVL